MYNTRLKEILYHWRVSSFVHQPRKAYIWRRLIRQKGSTSRIKFLKQSNINYIWLIRTGARYRWLRHYAASRKIAGSIPDEVTNSFQQQYGPWGEPSLWNIWVPGTFRRVNGGRHVRLTTCHSHLWADCPEMWEPRRLTKLCASTTVGSFVNTVRLHLFNAIAWGHTLVYVWRWVRSSSRDRTVLLSGCVTAARRPHKRGQQKLCVSRGNKRQLPWGHFSTIK
jgi:hypothetical protein